MSLSPTSVDNGVYKIFNVQYPTQDADLLYPGGDTGIIGGHETNDKTKRMQWNLTNVSEQRFSLVNQDVTTYASIGSNLGLVGNPDGGAEWIASSTGVSGDYYIAIYDTTLVWTLSNGTDGTPITVGEVFDPQQNNTQVWRFVPVD